MASHRLQHCTYIPSPIFPLPLPPGQLLVGERNGQRRAQQDAGLHAAAVPSVTSHRLPHRHLHLDDSDMRPRACCLTCLEAATAQHAGVPSRAFRRSYRARPAWPGCWQQLSLFHAGRSATIPAKPQLVSLRNGLRGRIASELVRNFLSLGPVPFEQATAVQSQVLSLLPSLAEAGGSDRSRIPAGGARDLFVQAPAGSGRTLSFLLPAIQRRINTVGLIRSGSISNQIWSATTLRPAPTQGSHSWDYVADLYRKAAMGALVVCPSHPIAMRVHDYAQRLVGTTPFGVHVLTDAHSREDQLDHLHAAPLDLVIATPARLNYFLATRPDLGRAAVHLETLVLNAIDAMIMMGSQEEVHELLARLPGKKERLNLLFTQDVSPAIEEIARKALSERCYFLKADSQPASALTSRATPPRPPQERAIVYLSAAEAIPLMASLILQDQHNNPAQSKVVILCPTNGMASMVAQLLQNSQWPPQQKTDREGYGTDAIPSILYKPSTGHMGPRSEVLDRFRSVPNRAVLVTKEVNEYTLTGLSGVSNVIHFGMPESTQKLTQSISWLGGRAGQRGAGQVDLVLAPPEASFVDFQLNTRAGQQAPPLVASEEVWCTHAELGLARDRAQRERSFCHAVAEIGLDEMQGLYNEAHPQYMFCASQFLRSDPAKAHQEVEAWFAQFSPHNARQLFTPTPTYKPKRYNQPERWGGRTQRERARSSPFWGGGLPRWSDELVEALPDYGGLDGYSSGFGSPSR